MTAQRDTPKQPEPFRPRPGTGNLEQQAAQIELRLRIAGKAGHQIPRQRDAIDEPLVMAQWDSA